MGEYALAYPDLGPMFAPHQAPVEPKLPLEQADLRLAPGTEALQTFEPELPLLYEALPAGLPTYRNTHLCDTVSL